MFMNKVVVFKSKDNAFESPCNLSQCEKVEFCLHNLPRLTQNLQWCLLAPGVTPATWHTYPKIVIQPRYQQKHEAPFPLQKSKASPYIIWWVFGPHAGEFEQNRMVQTIQNFVLFDKKWLTIIDKVLAPFWKTFLWLKQLFDAKLLILTIIFQCSKNYGTPTRVTRLKVAPNMAEPISLNENLP